MLGFNRWHLFMVSAATLCSAAVAWLALAYFIPAPPSTISMAVGGKGGSYELLAARYKEILARAHVELEFRYAAGGSEHFGLLQDQNSGVNAAFVQGGVSDSKQAPGLLSLGRINYQIFCVFYRATEVLDDLTELKGKRIAVGRVGTAARIVAQKILEISDITSETATFLTLGDRAAVDALIDGRADAAILGLSSDSPLIQSLLRDSRVQLVSITRAEALTRIFPFLVRLVLPQGAIDFAKKIPASDIVLFSTTNAVLVRNDLHPALITLLAQTLLETHSGPGLFQRAGEFPTQTDPEFPIAPAALDFYKNGLSFLNQYVPFWITNLAQRLIAVLAAVVAIGLPLFSYAPKLYKSLVEVRLNSMYRRLRTIEARLQEDVTALEVSVLEAELESVDRAIHILGVPMRHSAMFFSIKSHVDLVRVRLELRRAGLPGQKDNAA